MELIQLSKLALAFSTAINAVPVEGRPIGMHSFPRGACGDASLLLGAYLVDKGIGGFEYVCGERGSKSDNTWTSYAWLQRGNCVVDLTAGQFDDAPQDIVVADPSEWHSTFDFGRTQEADFRLWSGYGAEMLHRLYAQVQANISLLCGDS